MAHTAATTPEIGRMADRQERTCITNPRVNIVSTTRWGARQSSKHTCQPTGFYGKLETWTAAGRLRAELSLVNYSRRSAGCQMIAPSPRQLSQISQWHNLPSGARNLSM